MIDFHFMVLFFSSALASAVAVGLLRRFQEPNTESSPAFKLGPKSLSMGQQAMLVGGPDRVWETWVIALLAGGHLSVEFVPAAPTRLSRQGLPPPQDMELLQAWMEIPATHSVSQKELARLWSPLSQDVCQSLVAKGVLKENTQRRPWWTWLPTASSAAALVWSITSGHQEIGYPIVAGLILGQLLCLIPDYSRYQRTRASALLAGSVKDHHYLARRAPQADTLPWAVATGGLAVLAGTPFSALAYPPGSPRHSQGSSSDAGLSFVPLGDGGMSSTTTAGSGFSTGGGFGEGADSSGDSGSDGGGDGGGGCGGGGCGGA